MALSDHVQLTITLDSVGIARAGFGVPMILSHCADWEELIRYYNTLADVAADFDEGTPELRAATALFSQSPHPTSIAIGNASSVTVMQQYTVSIRDVRDSFAYKILVKGEGFDDTTITVTSDSAASNDEIVAALVTQLNTVTDKNYTAALVPDSSGNAYLTATGNADCDWFSLEMQDVTALTVAQTHTVTGLGTALDAILLEDSGWYCLLTHYNSDDYVADAATWVEANERIYVVDTNENDSILTSYNAMSSTDTLANLMDQGYKRTMGGYHPNPAAFFSAAWMGRWLPTEPGSATTKFKTLSGVEAVTLTGTHRNNLLARRANSYQTVAGRNITWEGTVPSTIYRFLDVTRDIDWLQDDMSKGVFGALAGADKVPYTDSGIALVENEVRGSCLRAITKGVFASTPAPVVTAPRIEDVEASDKEDRILRDVKFTGTLAGAIHKVLISGVVSF